MTCDTNAAARKFTVGPPRLPRPHAAKMVRFRLCSELGPAGIGIFYAKIVQLSPPILFCLQLHRRVLWILALNPNLGARRRRIEAPWLAYCTRVAQGLIVDDAGARAGGTRVQTH